MKAGLIIHGYMVTLLFLFSFTSACQQEPEKSNGDTPYTLVPFGEGGQLKMIYDRRQRPQALCLDKKVYMVYNGGYNPEARGKNQTHQYIISYDLEQQRLSEPMQLSEKTSGDQHYCPIIWADNNGHIHAFFGCHKTPGTHLVSASAGSVNFPRESWIRYPEVVPSLSYPTLWHLDENRQLMYYRTREHRSSWSYAISEDEGETWENPENDVTDLNRGEDTLHFENMMNMDEMSSYHTTLPSKDGKHLHLAFCAYDDNKSDLPEKYYNPRYKTYRNLGLKYNLYYLYIDLETGNVTNFSGEAVGTPVDMETANEKCMIWNTEWRGAGVPPDIMLDENQNPAFLHVLTGDTPEICHYYYVQYTNGMWEKNLISEATDDWNSGYIRRDSSGTLHSYLLMNNPSFSLEKGRMDSRGGGHIEEWISEDGGKSWEFATDLTPDSETYPGWKYNNIQPVRNARGEVIEGMLLFYGWKDPKIPGGKGFLLVEDSQK